MELLCARCGYRDAQYRGYGMYTAIWRLLFTHAIILGEVTDNLGFSNRWCYETYPAAKAALIAWDPVTEAEPQGWHRHPFTGRVRPHGDATQEFIPDHD